jgi:dihydroflavonol-4-reductase
MIFVTGGTGMVGAHLIYELVTKGEKVRALKRRGSSLERIEKIFSFCSSDPRPLLEAIEWVEGDILDKEGLKEHLIGIDQIYHAAAILSFDSRDREIIVSNNTEGTANIVDLALTMEIKKFCHISSVAAIGSAPEGIEANEEHPWRYSRETSPYSQSKYQSEMEVWRATLQGLDAVIINPAVIIGPGDWKSGSSLLISRVWKGFRFYTKGGTGFVDINDVTAAAQLLMEDENWESTKNQRFILNAENIRFRDIFNLIADELKVKRPSLYAGTITLKIAWRLSTLLRFLFGIAPSITRDTARSANKLSYYDGSKICRTVQFKYLPISESVKKSVQIFKKDYIIR